MLAIIIIIVIIILIIIIIIIIGKISTYQLEMGLDICLFLQSSVSALFWHNFLSPYLNIPYFVQIAQHCHVISSWPTRIDELSLVF